MKYRLPLFCLLLAGALTMPVSAAVVTTVSTGGENTPPVAKNLTLTTYQDIAITSTFSAVDPEGDLITYQVVDRPARGQVTLDETDTSTFWYTPYENKKGSDVFSYVAIDSMGNVSEPATVEISITVPTCGVTYADLDGSPCHYAALRLAEEGIYVGRQMAGVAYFDADQPFTREEFLVLSMAVTGTQPLDEVSMTGFYDDQEISAWAKGYVSAAVMQGAGLGEQTEEGQVVFSPSDPITQLEAAVMLEQLLWTTDIPVHTTSVSQEIPAWASQSVANLEALDVVAPGATLSDTLTRGEAAQMLSAALDVVDSRETSWFQ